MSELGKEEILATLSLLKKRCPYVTFTWEGHTINVAQAYAQLKAIVEQHFLDPGVKTEILAQEYEKGLKDGYEHAKKEQPDIDTEGVEEKISKWIDENIRMNELTIVEDHIYADEAQKEIDILRRIKQLLARQPQIKSEPGGLAPGEYMHEWMEKDAVELDLPTEEIIGNLCRDNKLLKEQLDEAKQKPQKRVTGEWMRETVSCLEMATDPISAEGALEDRLKELGIKVGVEDGEKIRLDTVQVKAEWVMDFIDGIDDVFKIERPYTFYVDIAAFFSPKNFVEYLNEKLKEHG